MELSHLLVEKIENIYLLTINRPKAMNALNDRVFAELKYLFDVFFLENDAKAVVIHGAGEKSFVAGADIKGFVGMDASQAGAKAKEGKAVFEAIESAQFPVIACIDGYTLGGGLELALACHIRYATHQSSFGCPEVSLGILPGWGAVHRLPKMIGKSMALDMILTGDMITAERAFQLGLVNQLFRKEEVLEKSIGQANRLSKKSMPAIREILSLFNSNDFSLDSETEAFSRLAATPEFIAGVERFLNRK